jgi:hypothetical protein
MKTHWAIRFVVNFRRAATSAVNFYNATGSLMVCLHEP